MDRETHEKIDEIAQALADIEDVGQIYGNLSNLYREGRIDGMEALAEKLELNVNLNHD